MLRLHIHRRGGRDASTASKLLGVVLVVFALACVVLMFLGLWILLAVVFAAMAIAALAGAVLPSGRARKPVVGTHTIIDGQATTLRDVDGVNGVGGKEGASSPSLDGKP